MLSTHHILTGDLYNITGRLKEIDKGYFVAYHYKKKRFEVHNRFQRGGSFCLAVSYETLDARTVELVRKTRCERVTELLKEAERDNARLNKQLIYGARRKAERKLGVIL